MASKYSLDNPVFAQFLFYGTVVVLKMFALALMTSFRRLASKTFANPEDAAAYKVKPVTDDSVERVRRNHLNDLENIPAFLITGLFYIAIGPSLSAAVWHFRLFTVSRIFHTIAYQLPLPQPSRGLSFLVGLSVTLSMALQVIFKTL